jgi:septum formation protein
MTSAAATRLILASASPRRRDLLAQIGLHPEIIPAHIDESRHANEAPKAYVQRLALEKARAIHALHADAKVIGADTTVELDGTILNKPRDPEDAERMLRRLSGRTHHVHTGVAVVSRSGERSHVETTAVTFAAVPESALAAYVASGDPLDKAGAYGIQGFAAQWIPRIEGDYFNVVGLPLAAVARMLQEAHV